MMYKNFICPVKNARITSNFGYRTIFGKKEWHQGVDIASTGKVPIYASADGEVYRTGALSTYGNVVMIKHDLLGKRMDTNYAHLDSYCVKVGQKVKQGQQIGVMGNTGRSTGVHLHFEVHNGAWKAGQPNAVDPMNYISVDDWGNQAKAVNLKIGYNIVEGAKAFRIQSGKYNNKSDAEKVKSTLLDKKYFSYAEIKGNEKDGYRVQSGKYTSKDKALDAAEKAYTDEVIRYATILGNLS